MPTSATGEDLVQMVSGKLTKEGRNPRNTKVVVLDDQLQLEDECGVFMTVTLTEEEEQRTEPEQESDDREEGCSEDAQPFKEDFQLLQAEKVNLEQRLREAELQRQTERYAQLWRLNCDQHREFDHLIGETEAQVRELTSRLIH